MKWLVLIIFGIGVIALIVFLVRRNQKDEADFEDQLNQSYRKPKKELDDDQIDGLVK